MSMHRRLLIGFIIFMSASLATARPMTKSDQAQLQNLPQRFVQGWLRNSRDDVMGLFAPEAVFIPHDGVPPHVGRAAIEQFWFPGTGAAGTVTAFTKTVDGLSGDGDKAVLWGKSNLNWQNQTTAYRWKGYYLMVLQRRGGRWLVTHLMASDEQPTSQPVVK